MRKNYLINPKIVDKVVNFESLKKVTKFAVNCFVDNCINALGGQFEFLVALPSPAIKGYSLGQKTYAYCQDGYLYEISQSGYQKIRDCGQNLPLLTEILIDGKNKIMIILDDEAYFLDGETKINIPIGTKYVQYLGRLFIAQGKNIYFGGQFNFSSYSISLQNSSFIATSDCDGDILDLIEYEDYLAIICEKAIYKLSISEEGDFKIKKINLDVLDIKKDSIVKIGNKILFISFDNLFCFEKGSLKKIESIFDEYKLLKNGDSINSDNYYCLNVKGEDDGNYIFVFDTIKNISFLIPQGEIVFLGNGFAIDNSSKKLIIISFLEHSKKGGKWLSQDIDFNNNLKKSLHSLKLYTTDDALLKISGDFGKRIYQLKKGYNKKYFNLYSTFFAFELEFLSSKFKAENLQLNYALEGE